MAAVLHLIVCAQQLLEGLCTSCHITCCVVWPLLQTVWVDPICGDGTCEAPFEFAAFSRFGCKADCGRLSDIQRLTSAQVCAKACGMFKRG